CFGVSEEYIKYAMVCIKSIIDNVKNVDKNVENDKFVFHIFTENCTVLMQDKINKTINELNQIYPCEIFLHFVEIDEFKNFSRVPWSNHAAMFYKIQAPKILHDIDKILFLGADTLCVDDIRELFDLDLKDNIIAAAWDCCNYQGYVRRVSCNDLSREDLIFYDSYYYINNDVMLINVKEWLKNNIEEKCAYYLTNYKLEGTLDVFPLVTAPKIYLLDNSWNLMVGPFTRSQIGLDNSFKDKSLSPIWNYTQAEFFTLFKNAKIIQFCNYECYKPWENPYNLNFYGVKKDYLITYPYYNTWWMLAFSLKEFRKDFQEIQINNEKNAISFYCKLIEENTFKSKMYNNHIHKKKIRLYGLLKKILNIIKE
ncbi:glycosyltransferase family 8 protein, partial [Campylobacter jejuni]|nr:glycosyltransferase family 8 protein [Campylobacter jejuni]